MGLSRAGAQGHPNENLGPRHLLDHHLNRVMPPRHAAMGWLLFGCGTARGPSSRDGAIMICVSRAFPIGSEGVFKLFALVLELVGPSKPRPTLETS